MLSPVIMNDRRTAATHLKGIRKCVDDRDSSARLDASPSVFGPWSPASTADMTAACAAAAAAVAAAVAAAGTALLL